MLYKYGKTLGLALAILGLASTLAFAQQGPKEEPVSTGVVATITTVDAKTGMATLKTEAGKCLSCRRNRCGRSVPRWSVTG